MIMEFKKKLKKLKGDASLRKFYRNNNNKSIIVIANKEKNKNLLVYDAINKILIKNNILAPKLFNQNYHKNYIEIQDLGSKTIYQILKKKNINSYLIFKKVIKILNKIQLIKDKKIKNFKNKLYKIKKYNNQILYKEAKLFCDWYAPKKLPKKAVIKFNSQFKKEVKLLLSKLNYKNNTFVHRDFHVSNLVYSNKKVGVIDSQDALIGNKAYDLASLIDDVRFKTHNKLKEKIFNYYVKENRTIKIRKFRTDFEILSVLRNLKIIGIFMRLAAKDNKKKYLKLIPYAWQMIDYRTSKNKVFNKLTLLLKYNFPKF
jgi:N-acetylmuramate 1-kinase